MLDLWVITPPELGETGRRTIYRTKPCARGLIGTRRHDRMVPCS
jgi:hypothetical protein